jgi:hypothetical protein
MGQIIGNTYGLSYEFTFIDEPGPDEFPYGYGSMLERVREVDGAFSDDDTDIEYMYLLQMEAHGPEPGYGELAAAWKHHIRERIWAANRVALTLMRHGYYPPVTGSKAYNPRWFEIDPQLVNEIWAVTAPGMIDYAVAKSEWAARMTSSDFGLEPTKHYAAMYAAAFFESDINRLIDIGTSVLEPDSRFAEAVEEMKALYRRYPNDWQAARKVLKEHYFDDQPHNIHGWPPIDATLNGAAGILALLYGQGDIQHTLDMACAIGFDADNQAATMTGLLGVVHGIGGFPEHLLFPIPEAGWGAPFNDRYRNVTRFDMPDARISDQILRMAAQGEQIVRLHGGARDVVDGTEVLRINTNAQFQPRFELLPAPVLKSHLGRPFEYTFYTGRKGDRVTWTTRDLPPGLAFRDGVLRGTATAAGRYPFTLEAAAGTERKSMTYTMWVRPPNLASSATRVLHNRPDSMLAVVRDGLYQDPAFYSRPADNPERIFYGYEWETPQLVGSVGFHVGWPQEETGWFASIGVEVRESSGDWEAVRDLSIDPDFPGGDNHYLKPGFVEYSLRFDPVEATAVRIIGTSGGRRDVERPIFQTAISELTVHAP